MLKIAITHCTQYDNYARWLKKYAPLIEDVQLSYQADNLSAIKKCEGLVLTGEGDVDPAFYYPEMPHEEKKLLNGIDRKRDDLELKAIKQALNMKIPILGICRGCQISNVYFGGTLIRDLAEKNEVHRKQGDEEKSHLVKIAEGSLLHKISGSSRTEVNSSHHQAPEKVGDSLFISARSEDGVIEALEYREKQDKEFLLLVQWHPERMESQDNPLYQNIALSFLSSIKHKLRRKCQNEIEF